MHSGSLQIHSHLTRPHCNLTWAQSGCHSKLFTFTIFSSVHFNLSLSAAPAWATGCIYMWRIPPWCFLKPLDTFVCILLIHLLNIPGDTLSFWIMLICRKPMCLWTAICPSPYVSVSLHCSKVPAKASVKDKGTAYFLCRRNGIMHTLPVSSSIKPSCAASLVL